MDVGIDAMRITDDGIDGSAQNSDNKMKEKKTHEIL